MRRKIKYGDQARAFPAGDAGGDRRDPPKSGRRLPYTERIRLKKQAQRRKRREEQRTTRKLRVGTLNVGTMTGRGREVVDMMERRKINILCVQETKWKGEKAREMGNGYKMYYVGHEAKRNGVGIVLDPEMKEGVLQVHRKSDRVMWVKMELVKEVVNIVCAYAPQVGCDAEEKENFWKTMGEVMLEIPGTEKVWIGADLNGHVGGGVDGYGSNIGKFGFGTRNEEGDNILEFVAANNLAITNTYFQKSDSRRITYTSGGVNSQVDYIICRRSELKRVQDCKVLPGEAVAKQHKVVTCTATVKAEKTKKRERTRKTRWWKLNESEHREKFVEKAMAAINEQREKSWEETSRVLKDTAKEILGVTSGKPGRKEETWWWCDEVQEAVKVKKEMKKQKDFNRCEETIEAYKVANKAAKRAVAMAKAEAYKDLYDSLTDDNEGQRKAIRIAKQKHRESQDVYQGKQMKDANGVVLTDENDIKERWRTYFEQLMNVENDRIDSVIEARPEEVIDVITAEEVERALRKMKKGKATGPDDIPVEAWKVLGRTGVIILLEIFTTIMETEKMPDEWRESTLIPIFKNKGDIQDCGNYRGIKLMAHTLKMWERVIEKRLREKVDISEQQFGFMPGWSTTDAIFAQRQLMEKYREGQKGLHSIFIDLEKAYDRVPRTEVWNCLRLKEVQEKYIRLIQDMYEGSKANVKCMVGTTESFQVKVGLHQGSALSPFLFAIVIDCLTEAVQKIAPWDLMFADDVALNGETNEDVEERLEQWRSALEDRGMKVSRHKTEYLYMGDQDPERAVEMQGLKLNRVQEFKYLGSTLQSDGASDKEVGKRIQAGWNAWRKITGLLCDRRVPAKLKGRIFKTMVRPAMLYGMEAVAVTKGQERKMEVAEMRMLRFSLGKTRLDRVRNSTIRETMGVGELEKKLRECRLRWLGHVVLYQSHGATAKPSALAPDPLGLMH
ncbi:uncharacterized protein LOC125048346 [Penaeus chinensis]|uniref:uncharacterized protein LOC125048346 n=1 Tax=Penaeus chinensis TaxID=139456 RepID=UPI001FB6209B|nr:uncharacterized protein LOC125048346 [Penaeus chinensis]